MALASWRLARRGLLGLAGSLAVASRGHAGGWLAERVASARGVRWLAFYGTNADERVLAGYDLVVLDPMFQGNRSLIVQHGACLAGYLSLGEIRIDDPSFPLLDPAAVLGANADWPGTRRLDIRHPAWRKLVLDRIIPAMIAGGFAGLFLDTLDTPAFLERQDPESRRGMLRAAVDLVRAIRDAFPRLTLLMNRGYELLPHVADSIDAVVAESLVAACDPERCRMNSLADIIGQLTLIDAGRRPGHNLPVLSLDYWNPLDNPGLSAIYMLERRLGHQPYVGTRLLNEIVFEPDFHK